jgi:type II secretory pathway pseudopilin PulG
MTLVELLVVVAIMMLLLVSVIPNLAPTADQKCREAALTFTSAISRAQSRAQKNTGRGAGLWLQPLESSVMAGGDTARGSADLFVCEPQDPYVGDDPSLARAFITGTNLIPGFPADMTVVAFSAAACPFIQDICAASSRIRIGPNSSGSPTFFFRLKTKVEQQALAAGYFPLPYRDPVGSESTGYPTKDPENNLHVALLKLIPPDGPEKLPTPTATTYSSPPELNLPGENVGTEFSIERPITRSATPPLTMPAGYIVDTAWSCVGTMLLTNSLSRRIGTPVTMRCIDNFLSNQPVQIMFNESSGGVDKIRFKLELPGFGVVDDERTVTSDIYLLIGRADRAGNAHANNPSDDTVGANWQYPDSRWVRISRSSGETLIADPVLNVPDVYQSQGYVRTGLEATRK